MSETEHEDTDEAAGTPVDEPGPSDDETDAEEAEEAETPSEPAEASQARKSEREIEKALKTVERAGTTYRNAIGRAMGEDAQALEPCPRCNAPVAGMIFPQAMAPVDDETREAVLASIGSGVAAGPPLQPASGVETCPQCQGNGQLEFPTFVEHTRVQQCPKCLGSGYVNKDTPQENVYTFQQSQGGTNQGNTATTNFDMLDSWGRPIGHPHYGIAPAQVGT